jgi:hypothetical protein
MLYAGSRLDEAQGIFAVGDPSLAAYPPTKRQQTQVLQHRPSNVLAPAASDAGLPKRQNPVALLNARGPEIRRGYDLRETSGDGDPQVMPNRKAGYRGNRTVRSSHQYDWYGVAFYCTSVYVDNSIAAADRAREKPPEAPGVRVQWSTRCC